MEKVKNALKDLFYKRKRCLKQRIISTTFIGVIRTFLKLLKYTLSLFILARLSNRGVFILTTWNSILPIRQRRVKEPIKYIELILNYIVIALAFNLFSLILLVFLQARN